MQISSQFVELVKAIAWPAVAAFALYLLRRPLIELVAQIARRAKKLSAYQISIELAELPKLYSSLSVEIQQLTPVGLFESDPTQLLNRLKDILNQDIQRTGRANYAVVDLGEGQKWLTSRLFIFALVLGTVTELQAFVFLETSGGFRRRFLGVATPSNVLRGLASRYPDLVTAAANIHAPLFDNAPAKEASDFVYNFLKYIQISKPPESEGNRYLEISKQPPLYEKARWIDGERLERYLSGYLDYAWYEDTPEKPRRTVAEEIAQRKGAFVALVDRNNRFTALIDRYTLLDQMWKQQEDRKSNAGQ